MNNKDSIILRSGLTMGGIVILALLSMTSSVFIAESSKGDATAINLAGSLRMQSYRIATRLQNPLTAKADRAHQVAQEIDEFERRLARLWQTGVASLAVGHPRYPTLRIIESLWRETLRPTLEASASETAPSAAYLREIDNFVAELDAFVKLLEQDTEAKILLLRLVQGLALFVTLLLIFAAMHQLHYRVVTPLRDLVELAGQARRGDLSVRARHVGSDELGVLGQAFNLMATDLSAMYADLEARVEQQTQALRISNRSLELLYHAARRLGGSTPNDVAYPALLTDIEKLTGADSVKLCLIDSVTRQATRVFPMHLHSAPPPFFCSRPNCESCLGDGATHPLDADRQTFSIPVHDQERQFGVLIVRNSDLDSAASWQLPLLEAVARNIATALQANEQTEHRRRLALLEERNAIARELHDSLAQALSYLKIQVSRLYALINHTGNMPEAHAITDELRAGLSNAHRQLRELIATFRLKMEHPRLEESLREVVAEFSRRSGLSVDLDHAEWTCVLDPNEQIHVMQIIREALNNAVKHAHAHRILVRLRCRQNGEAIIEVVDDGVGIPACFDRGDHFGIHIMRERSEHLGGTFDISSKPGQGARVQLCFRPVGYQDIRLEPAVEAGHA